jgi:hypothetical protein
MMMQGRLSAEPHFGESRSESTSLGRPMEPRPRRPARTGALAHGSGLQLELECQWAGRARAALLPVPGGARAGPGPAAVTGTPGGTRRSELRVHSGCRNGMIHKAPILGLRVWPRPGAAASGSPGIDIRRVGMGIGDAVRVGIGDPATTVRARGSRVAGLQWHAYSYGSIPCLCISAGTSSSSTGALAVCCELTVTAA